jgi:hypothetical protein
MRQVFSIGHTGAPIFVYVVSSSWCRCVPRLISLFLAHVLQSHESWREHAPPSTCAPEPTELISGAHKPLHFPRPIRLAEPTSPHLRSRLRSILVQFVVHF